jgi:hypothetical protein
MPKEKTSVIGKGLLLKIKKLFYRFLFFSPRTFLLRYNVNIADGTDDGAQVAAKNAAVS